MTSIRIIALTALLLAGAGCSSKGPKEWKPEVERHLFGIAVRQDAPQPVYKRTRLVYPPSPLPQPAVSRNAAPGIFPVIHLDLEDASLEEASRILGQSARYASYCASTIADQRITLSTLGTLDELASALEREANISVVVDHHNREVRFIAKRAAVEPQLLEQRHPRGFDHEY